LTLACIKRRKTQAVDVTETKISLRHLIKSDASEQAALLTNKIPGHKSGVE